MWNCVRRRLRLRLGRREQLLLTLLLRGERTVKAVTLLRVKAGDVEVIHLQFLGTLTSLNQEPNLVGKAMINVAVTGVKMGAVAKVDIALLIVRRMIQ